MHSKRGSEAGDKVRPCLALHPAAPRNDRAANKTDTMDASAPWSGYADTSKHGRVRSVISLGGNSGALRFQLLKAIQAGL